MRRLPIYFLIDVSESMVGTPIEQVQEGIRTIIQSLRTDPYALETVFVSVIVFAGKAKVLTPLTEIYKFYPPKFPIGGGTSLGKGLECLMDDIDSNVQKTTLEQKGDWKPIIFLFSDGNPTDNYADSFCRWNDRYRLRCNLVAVSIGNNLDVLTFAQITDDILLLKDTDPESFRQFFKWVTASIKSSSMSISDQGCDTLKLPSTSGINLEKVHPDETSGFVDENFVVLHGRCQHTGQDYLIKYCKRGEELNPQELETFADIKFRLVGAYPIDGETYSSLTSGEGAKINTAELLGMPTCPCCGNQLGAVVCECGHIMCVGEEVNNKCPWCGIEGTLGSMEPGGMDIARGRG